MRLKIALIIIVVSLAVLTLVAFGGVGAPDLPRTDRSAAAPLGTQRLFMLLADGKVEVTDAWARRVYRWDGRTWVQLAEETR